MAAMPPEAWGEELRGTLLALLVGGPEMRAAVEELAASDEAVRKRLFVSDARDQERWNTVYEPEYVERIRQEANYLLTDPKRTPQDAWNLQMLATEELGSFVERIPAE